jgi:hypothetical protein
MQFGQLGYLGEGVIDGTVALIDRMARPADDVWAVRSDRCGQFVERCRDA